MMATIGMPTSESAPADAPPGGEFPSPPQPDGRPDALIETPQQRDYVDALKAAGVKPSSDLLALRIGSYVCQARAAKQSDQAVWDFVLPLVRSDVRDNQLSVTAPAAGAVNSATADYIRIATERLC